MVNETLLKILHHVEKNKSRSQNAYFEKTISYGSTTITFENGSKHLQSMMDLKI